MFLSVNTEDPSEKNFQKLENFLYLVKNPDNLRDPYDLVPVIEKPQFDKKMQFEKEIQKG